ncbi:hypothetical protein A3D77_02285 [Candidatus Gottesmanbacteria bacterium RIFCSPHIGHO2_02_FULL_39_11]|uniref:Penicillin-binding protein transpeptidase domain-containing protein n=1 Tax=Candidatus Gottesmanbacteria bacterium RIFCSPHIGHO2_02_FULL_39_11 TaxID=1798382 RepID=A0A1F5ZVB1_9BACT|nr:MAG: hypothetical protein A3D77_02285 [Candidatus Gottesmanbacteria bacterium RIFCSPHIGHO2_02_FULL_39_11]
MHKRIYVVFIVFVLGFMAVIARLFYWQILSFDRLKGIADDQTVHASSIYAKRGRIFSSDGAAIVMNRKGYMVFVEKDKIKNQTDLIKSLSGVLTIPESTLSGKLSNSLSNWTPLVNKISEDKIKKLESSTIPGLGFLEESNRYYPEGSMAANIIGFVGKNSKGLDQGYFGLEGFYDEQLRGRDGMIKQEKDAIGNPILLEKMSELPSEDGRDLYLTIDKTVQYIAEAKLKESIEEYQAKGGTVTIMEPQTGAILGMVSYPSYDPTDYGNYPAEFYINSVVGSSYEPGSTFKVLVMAAAINEGVLTPDTTYNEDGPVNIGGYTIRTWNNQYNGPYTSMTDVLVHSSNVGMVFAQSKLGGEKLLSYIKNLGFGENTDIDLQDESSPAIRSGREWRQIDFATASFGQGIAVTPLQMVRAVASIANGGKLVKPYLVKKIKLSNGREIEMKPTVIRTVFKKETATKIAQIMVHAVDDGEAHRLKPAGFNIAGKTGTAQIPIAGHYDPTKTIASFVGFAPVDNPKFIMLVTINEPSTSQWGSETAAPTFFNIAKELFSYYGISPSSGG